MTILSSEFVVVVVRFHCCLINLNLLMFVRSASKVIYNGGILNQMMMMYLSLLLKHLFSMMIKIWIFDDDDDDDGHDFYDGDGGGDLFEDYS